MTELASNLTPGSSTPGSLLLGKEFIIAKSYARDDGTVGIEGWISTPMKDMEKDILEPEAFAGPAFSTYFKRGAPISSEHNTKAYPVGYLQKAVLVRDGVVIQEENNPKYDITQFRTSYGTGTGWYGLGSIYEPVAALNVSKGTVGSFSWIGSATTWEDLGDGGRRFSKKGAINPLLEVTITAYPINQAAILRVAKAHGIPTEEEKEPTKPATKIYSIPTQALIDVVMKSTSVQEMTRLAVERAFEKKDR